MVFWTHPVVWYVTVVTVVARQEAALRRLTVLCMYITAPPVNYSILCIVTIVHMVAFVNLLLKKMVVVVVAGCVI